MFVPFLNYYYKNTILSKSILYFYFCSNVVSPPNTSSFHVFSFCAVNFVCLLCYDSINCISTLCLKIQPICLFFAYIMPGVKVSCICKDFCFFFFFFLSILLVVLKVDVNQCPWEYFHGQCVNILRNHILKL